MLLFHFHTQHANALWKVPSRFPPGHSKGGRGWVGMEGFSPRYQPLPRGGLNLTPAACPVQTQGSGTFWEQTTALACALWRVLGRMLALCSSLPRGSSGQALGPGFLSVLSAASPGNPQTFYLLPNDPVGFSSVCRLTFGQNLNLTLTKNK